MYGLLKSGKSCRGGVPSPPVFCAAGAGCRAANSRRQRDCCLYFPNPEAALYGLLKSGKSCRGGVPSPPIFCAAGAGCRAANSRRQRDCCLCFSNPEAALYGLLKSGKSCRGGVPSPPVFVPPARAAALQIRAGSEIVAFTSRTRKQLCTGC